MQENLLPRVRAGPSRNGRAEHLVGENEREPTARPAGAGRGQCRGRPRCLPCGVTDHLPFLWP